MLSWVQAPRTFGGMGTGTAQELESQGTPRALSMHGVMAVQPRLFSAVTNAPGVPPGE